MHARPSLRMNTRYAFCATSCRRASVRRESVTEGRARSCTTLREPARGRRARGVKTLTHTVVLPCSRETFWKTFLSPEYARTLYLDVLGYRSLDVLEATDTSRRLRIVPRVPLPSALEKILGDFSYEDHGTLDRERNLWTWKMVPPAPAGGGKPRSPSVTTRGSLRLEAVSDHECRRVDELVIEGHVFGVGGLIESAAEKEARAGWDKEDAYLRRRLTRSD